MPRLTDLKQENHVTLHLSEEACYELDETIYDESNGEILCLLLDQTDPAVIEVPTHFYKQGYYRVVITLGRHGNVIIYLFKRGRKARKFISDFHYLKAKTFIGYQEIPLPTFTPEEAYAKMEAGAIMKCNGAHYQRHEGKLWIKTNQVVGWREAKRQQLNKGDWFEVWN